jgi:mannose-1-phosphate guanylyltransferase/mannose-6-phosphate isomerase
MADACRRAVAAGDADLDFFRLDAAAFAECPSESIDYAVMEETGAAAVVPVDMGWSDVGSWAALWEIGEADADGNVLAGDVVVRDVHRSYVRSDGPLVAVIGLDDSVVVVTDDAVLVTTRERAQEVKALARLLAERRRSEFLSHTTVYRPWGHYQSLEAGDGFLVKLMCVKPRAKLSLQRHRHRAEHWVVVAGAARVTRGDEIVTVETNQSTYIPVGMKHRLENPGDSLLRVIEVQTGSRLSEDDIERLDDVYGRR